MLRSEVRGQGCRGEGLRVWITETIKVKAIWVSKHAGSRVVITLL